MTREGEVYFAKLIERGDENARREMIAASYPVAVAIARRFADRGVEMDDLIQEAQIGLYKATTKFNYRLGFRFGTCAQWWVRQRLGRVVRNYKQTVRVSIHTQELYAKACDTWVKLSRQLGREPTQEEVADALHISVKKLGEWMAVGPSGRNASFEQRESENLSLQELIADEQAVDPFDAFASSEAATLVAEMLSKLEPREECVLRMRYGIAGDDDLELQFGEDEPTTKTITVEGPDEADLSPIPVAAWHASVRRAHAEIFDWLDRLHVAVGELVTKPTTRAQLHVRRRRKGASCDDTQERQQHHSSRNDS